MKLICLMLGLVLMSGCATSIPQAENFPESKQKKMMAAQHWNLLAQDAVERTQATLTERGFDQDN